MEPFKNIVVGMDTSSLDENLVKYASFITDRSSAEKIYFVNIIRNLNVPSDVQKEFPDMVKNATKERELEIQKVVDEHFKPEKNVEVSIKIEKGQGPYLHDIAKKLKADLVIIGQKKKSKGTGVTTMRLARRASCSLLIVPASAVPKLDKVLVPVDFSENAKLAVVQSIDLVARGGASEVVCQNVYRVPVGYHYTGKSFDEFGKVMENNARENFKSFIKEIDTRGVKISEVYSLDRNDNLASDIYDLAAEIKPGIIVIGAKGRTAAAALFLGSLAEKMVHDKMNDPLLVTRFKGKNAGLIETIREL